MKITICLLLSSVLFCGCSSTRVSNSPSEPACVVFKEKSRFMDICEDVLQGLQFEVEKFDIDMGYIKTRPLRGGQFFEFWRRDNVGSKNFAESNTQSLLRTVELRIFQSGGEMCVSCDCNVRRLSIPEKDIVGFSQNAGIFTGGSVTMQKIRPKDTEDIDWIDLGPDHSLENRILERIKEKIDSLKGNN